MIDGLILTDEHFGNFSMKITGFGKSFGHVEMTYPDGGKYLIRYIPYASEKMIINICGCNRDYIKKPKLLKLDFADEEECYYRIGLEKGAPGNIFLMDRHSEFAAKCALAIQATDNNKKTIDFLLNFIKTKDFKNWQCGDNFVFNRIVEGRYPYKANEFYDPDEDYTGWQCHEKYDNGNEAVGNCASCGAAVDEFGHSVGYSCRFGDACEACGHASCNRQCC